MFFFQILDGHVSMWKKQQICPRSDGRVRMKYVIQSIPIVLDGKKAHPHFCAWDFFFFSRKPPCPHHTCFGRLPFRSEDQASAYRSKELNIRFRHKRRLSSFSHFCPQTPRRLASHGIVPFSNTPQRYVRHLYCVQDGRRGGLPIYRILSVS